MSIFDFEIATIDMTRNEDAPVEVSVEETLPPDKQIIKLKRFLETVFTFSNQGSPQTATSVKKLIMSLVNEDITPGAFFQDLQTSTRFPLRPYVVPFLHSSLPHLRERYARDKTALWKDIFDPEPKPATANHKSASVSPASRTTTRKRKALSDEHQASKSRRSMTVDKTSVDLAHDLAQDELQAEAAFRSFPSTSAIPRLDIGLSKCLTNGGTSVDLWAWYADEWRHIENMFTSLVSTMERLRYSMLLFQQKARLSHAWTQQLQQKRDNSGVKIEQVQRRAELTVQEVKRVAMADAQKLVAAAEQRTAAALTAERSHFERLLTDFNKQEDRVENCWNCGRRAGQTCSGCSRARYCGAYCQHKDWHRHRFTCAINAQQKSSQPQPKVTAKTIKVECPTPEQQPSRASPKSV